jgi:hypothetical protein
MDAASARQPVRIPDGWPLLIEATDLAGSSGHCDTHLLTDEHRPGAQPPSAP